MPKDTRKRVKLTFSKEQYRKATKVRKTLFPYPLESAGFRDVLMYLHDNLGAIQDFVTQRPQKAPEVTKGDQMAPAVPTPDPTPARAQSSSGEEIRDQSKKKKDPDLAPSELSKRILADLNERAGTNFQARGRKARSLIATRLAEGYKEADFYEVHRKKCADWLGTEWEKHLTYETLYGPKFEKYVGQREPTPGQGALDLEERWSDEDYLKECDDV